MSSVCLASPYSQIFNPSRNAEQESYFISFQGVGHLPKLFIENGSVFPCWFERSSFHAWNDCVTSGWSVDFYMAFHSILASGVQGLNDFHFHLWPSHPLAFLFKYFCYKMDIWKIACLLPRAMPFSLPTRWFLFLRWEQASPVLCVSWFRFFPGFLIFHWIVNGIFSPAYVVIVILGSWASHRLGVFIL